MTLSPVARELLDSRDGRYKQLPFLAYKLGEAGSFGMDIALPDQLTIDENRMMVVIPFADGKRRDGVGDLLEIGGIRTERHRQNPICLFDHGKQVALPVALTEDPQTKAYTVTLDVVSQIGLAPSFFYGGKGMPGVERSREYDHALFCEQLYDLLCKKYVRAGSIGYQVIDATPLQPDYATGTPQGLHLKSVNMLECSCVVLPANQDTVRKALCLGGVCGKPLSPYLRKCLEPYAATTRVVTGYKGQPVPLRNVRGSNKVPPARWKPGVGAIKAQGMREDEANYRSIEEGDAPMNENGKLKDLPSSHISPEKARQILKDDSAQGHKLTSKQRRMFGAAAGKDKKEFVGDLNWLNDEAREREHRRKALREHYRRKAVESEGDRIPPTEEVKPKIKPGHRIKPLTIDRRPIHKRPAHLPPPKPLTGNQRPSGGGYPTLPKVHPLAKTLYRKALRLRYNSKARESGLEYFVVQDGGKWWVVTPESWRGGGAIGPFPSQVRAMNRCYQLNHRLATGEASTPGVEVRTKALSTVRLKYRSAAGVRHKSRGSSAGSSLLYLHGKDLAEAEAEAGKLHLGFERVGVHKGYEKVRLKGDDMAIDSMAKKYGRTLKSVRR